MRYLGPKSMPAAKPPGTLARAPPPVDLGVPAAPGSVTRSESSAPWPGVGTDPDGVLLKVVTPGFSCGRERAEGAGPPMVRSSYSSRAGGACAFGFCGVLAASGGTNAAAQCAHRKAWGGFSRLQEGQFIGVMGGHAPTFAQII